MRRLRLGDAAYDIATSKSAPADRIAWLTHQLGRCALHHGKAADRAALAVRSPGAKRTSRDGERAGASCCRCSRRACAWLGDREGALARCGRARPSAGSSASSKRNSSSVGRGHWPSVATSPARARCCTTSAELARRTGYRSTEALAPPRDRSPWRTRSGRRSTRDARDRMRGSARRRRTPLMPRRSVRGRADGARRGRRSIRDHGRRAARRRGRERGRTSASARRRSTRRPRRRAFARPGSAAQCEGARTPALTAPVIVVATHSDASVTSRRLPRVERRARRSPTACTSRCAP